jgi:acyl-CoA thioesterase I
MRSLLLLICFFISANPATAAASTGTNSTTFVFLGDSLTAGYNLDVQEAYPALVEQLAQADKRTWRIINAGESGGTTAGGVRRMAWVLKAKPQVIVIALGANDGLRGLSVVDMKKNLTQIVTQAKNAGVKVLLVGMQLPRNLGEDYRQAFSAVYAQIAHEQQIPLLPFLLDGVGGQAALNLPDGIHPNPAGHKIIAQTVYAALKQHFQDLP